MQKFSYIVSDQELKTRIGWSGIAARWLQTPTIRNTKWWTYSKCHVILFAELSIDLIWIGSDKRSAKKSNAMFGVYIWNCPVEVKDTHLMKTSDKIICVESRIKIMEHKSVSNDEIHNEDAIYKLVLNWRHY